MNSSRAQDCEGTSLSVHAEGAEMIAKFVSSITRLCTDEGYQAVQATALDNQRLRTLLNETQTAYRKNLGELGQQAEEWKSEKNLLETKIRDTTKHSQRLEDEKTKAYRRLKAEQDAVAELRDKIKSLEVEVRRSIDNSKKHEEQNVKHQSIITQKTKELGIAEKEAKTSKEELRATFHKMASQAKALQAAEDNLSVFKSFTVELAPLGDEKERIFDILDSLFSASADFFNGILCRDLTEDLLKDSVCWDRARDHSAIQRGIPLPASNSAPAKKMRAIAGLAVYSSALNEFVFQPTYLSVGNELGKALNALSEVNPEQDALVRAVLLKALPDQQKDCRDTCVELVVKNVLAAVIGWVHPDQREAFKSGLTQLTHDICTKWQHVQRLQERVEPSFTLETLEDWKPWPTLSIPRVADNGVSVTPSRNGEKNHRPMSQGLERESLAPADVVKVVWPAFFATSLEQSADDEEGISDLVHHGYVLTSTDLQSARHEEMSRKPIRRAAREGNPATQRPRRDSGFFLSRVASGGSDAK